MFVLIFYLHRIMDGFSNNDSTLEDWERILWGGGGVFGAEQDMKRTFTVTVTPGIPIRYMYIRTTKS